MRCIPEDIEWNAVSSRGQHGDRVAEQRDGPLPARSAHPRQTATAAARQHGYHPVTRVVELRCLIHTLAPSFSRFTAPHTLCTKSRPGCLHTDMPHSPTRALGMDAATQRGCSRHPKEKRSQRCDPMAMLRYFKTGERGQGRGCAVRRASEDRARAGCSFTTRLRYDARSTPPLAYSPPQHTPPLIHSSTPQSAPRQGSERRGRPIPHVRSRRWYLWSADRLGRCSLRVVRAPRQGPGSAGACVCCENRS